MGSSYKLIQYKWNFESFLDTLIKHFEAVFPTVYPDRRNRQNNWISKGIRISCGKKRDLYIQCRNNRDNIQMARYYKKYCTILNKVIKEAKRQYFYNLIATSSNRVKTAWRIIRDNSGITPHPDTIDSLNCGNTLLKNPKDIAHAFNSHYSNTTIVCISNTITWVMLCYIYIIPTSPPSLRW